MHSGSKKQILATRMFNCKVVFFG